MNIENKKIIIIGAGEHAHVLLDLLLEQNMNVIGLSDSNPNLKGSKVYGIPVIGNDDDVIKNYKPSDVLIVNGMGSVGSTKIRAKVYKNFTEHGFNFLTVVHPSAIISKRAKLCEGAQVLAGAIINTEAVIGENTIINTKTSVDHGCNIGANCHIAPGCVLSGCVAVGDNTHIGTGSSIIQGINIGGNTLVGAGSVVVHDIPANVKAFGVPVKILNYTDMGGGITK